MINRISSLDYLKNPPLSDEGHLISEKGKTFADELVRLNSLPDYSEIREDGESLSIKWQGDVVKYFAQKHPEIFYHSTTPVASCKMVFPRNGDPKLEIQFKVCESDNQCIGIDFIESTALVQLNLILPSPSVSTTTTSSLPSIFELSAKATKELPKMSGPDVIEANTKTVLVMNENTQVDVLKKLILMGISIHTADQDSKNTALMDAVERGNLEAVKLLVTFGADLNVIITKFGTKTCAVLSALRKPEILEFLVASGADLDIRLNQKRTLLHYAADSKDTYKALCILLKHGAEVNAVDLYGKTPLHLGYHIKNNALILMEHGANIHALDHEGWKPLHRIYQYPNIDLLKAVVQQGGSLSEFTPDGKNALHLVSHMNDMDKPAKMNLLKFLIEDQKMSVNQHSKWYDGNTGSFTPLMLAIAAHEHCEEDFEIISYLLEQGGDMNAKVFHMLVTGKMYVLHTSVLSWATERKLPYYVIQWLQKNAFQKPK